MIDFTELASFNFSMPNSNISSTTFVKMIWWQF